MIQLQYDYCGLNLGHRYVRRQTIEFQDGHEQVTNYDHTYRFCDNDCMARWSDREHHRVGVNTTLECIELNGSVKN